MKGETICGQFYGKMEKKTDGIDLKQKMRFGSFWTS